MALPDGSRGGPSLSRGAFVQDRLAVVDLDNSAGPTRLGPLDPLLAIDDRDEIDLIIELPGGQYCRRHPPLRRQCIGQRFCPAGATFFWTTANRGMRRSLAPTVSIPAPAYSAAASSSAESSVVAGGFFLCLSLRVGWRSFWLLPSLHGLH